MAGTLKSPSRPLSEPSPNAWLPDVMVFVGDLKETFRRPSVDGERCAQAEQALDATALDASVKIRRLEIMAEL